MARRLKAEEVRAVCDPATLPFRSTAELPALDGMIGQDLSKIGGKYPEAYLLRWLRDPSAQKPIAHMPKIAMTEAEAQALAAFLASLR